MGDLRLRVLAGRGGLDRDVVWAHSIELVDPALWLAGGELLLTTGLRLTADSAACEYYVGRLVKAGVAAVGFGVGLSHEQVPEALVDAAEEAGLPLPEVALPTPFVAVTKSPPARPLSSWTTTARCARPISSTPRRPRPHSAPRSRQRPRSAAAGTEWWPYSRSAWGRVPTAVW
ncbi:PucR family transcriptional regulator ligand-binding domain-containing protein [Streptomyces sp. NPDC001663]|uniref:PucR family transcriptional regulator ligand-binding domain-containing protein n=1 Tax=Streptomyces sp. NPDC001663 TaxID=3364597 RepID=UPI00368CCDED